ncbi:GGDEF domain-containing protein [Alteromonas sp. ASW11-19]|uniref:diguanylate cyclase n=1 Tax=Alteromonas salexigens TaxID=2982530 RepID=A0ABT2VNM2_9ALTE|nr:GGDEF domain-containing protein [Alteromonas salexigens]MCU7554911.1 GGDEF domain-containing protein [Alteromonas salexigens]
MEGKQLQSLKNHAETLTRFIIRLTKFYEGLSSDIDNELQTLRGHLAGSPNYTLATVSINKLGTKLQNAHASTSEVVNKSIDDLETDVKAFQQKVAQSSGVQQNAAQLLVKLNQPAQDLFAVLALYRQATRFFAVNAQAASPKPANPQSEPEKNARHYHAILDELNLLIKNYARKRPDDEQLLTIQAKLAQGMQEEELLQSCVVIIRMIVQEAMSEASLSGKVIQSLHKSLGQVSQNVSQTIDLSKASFATRKASTAQMQAQLETMEDAVNHSESLESLKRQAQQYVKNVSSTLSERAQAEQDEQHELLKLLASMQGQLTRLQSQTQSYRKKLAEQIVSSQTDSLTRLPNRQAYNERIERAFALAENGNVKLALAVADIDLFKSINDRFGHAAGDKTLQVVSRHLRKNLSKDDFIARWGGEEFVMLLLGVDSSGLQKKLEALRASLADIPFKFKQEKVIISASFGGTCLKAGDTPDEVFNRADTNLYKAKRSGRNCVITDQETTL